MNTNIIIVCISTVLVPGFNSSPEPLFNEARLGTYPPLEKGIQVCANYRQLASPKGDNNKKVKIFKNPFQYQHGNFNQTS
jgi:hypothetical protein